jgi:drug/metabolite transporter (DMT)-like permease
MPLFVYLYSLFFHKKPVDLRIFLVIFISLYGVSVIATRSVFPSVSNFGKGELFVLLSAASFAWFYAARKLLPSSLTNSEITVLTMPIALLILFVAAILSGEHFLLQNLFTVETVVGLIIGAGFNIVSSLFTSFSFQNLEAHFASQLLLLENVFSPVIGLIFYQEKINSIVIFGALIIILCIILSPRLVSD